MTPEPTRRRIVLERSFLDLLALEPMGPLTLIEQPSGNLYAVRSPRNHTPNLKNLELYFGGISIKKETFMNKLSLICFDEIRSMINTQDSHTQFAKQFEDGLVQIACFGYDTQRGLYLGVYGHLVSQRQKNSSGTRTGSKHLSSIPP